MYHIDVGNILDFGGSGCSFVCLRHREIRHVRRRPQEIWGSCICLHQTSSSENMFHIDGTITWSAFTSPAVGLQTHFLPSCRRARPKRIDFDGRSGRCHSFQTVPRSPGASKPSTHPRWLDLLTFLIFCKAQPLKDRQTVRQVTLRLREGLFYIQGFVLQSNSLTAILHIWVSKNRQPTDIIPKTNNATAGTEHTHSTLRDQCIAHFMLSTGTPGKRRQRSQAPQGLGSLC
jgi:hypothetical protein